MKEKIKTILNVLLIIAVFVGISYIVQTNLDFFKGLISENEIIGIFVYLSLLIVETIIAPLSTIPLIPLASSLYGWFWAGVITYIGWLIGAMIIFYICRRWGKPIVRKFVSLRKVNSYEKLISKRSELGALIILRMTIPVDILSYALGLFSNISWRVYIISAVVGFIPFTFILAYVGSLPFLYQIIGLALAGILVLIIILLERILKRDKKQEDKLINSSR